MKTNLGHPTNREENEKIKTKKWKKEIIKEKTRKYPQIKTRQ